MEPQDRLAPAHYRFIKAISVDDPMPLTPQGASAVRVRHSGFAILPCFGLPCLPCPAPPRPVLHRLCELCSSLEVDRAATF